EDSGIEEYIALLVVIVPLAADDHEIRVGIEACAGARVMRTTAYPHVFTERPTRPPTQLRDERGRQIHTDGAMGFALARHGVDQAIEIFMPIARGACALIHEIDVHGDPWDVADAQGHGLLLRFAVGRLSAVS